MDSLGGFSATSIYPLDLVAYMTVVVFLGEIGGGTIRRPSGLRGQLVPLLYRPSTRKITDLNVQCTKSSIDLQILDPLELPHAPRSFPAEP